jgi:hypothetical protein
MNDMSGLFQWTIDNKVSDNIFSSANTLTGLRNSANEMSYQFPETEDGLKSLVLLYRKWRPKTDKKNILLSWQAYQLAVAGIEPDDIQPRQIELFEEAQ